EEELERHPVALEVRRPQLHVAEPEQRVGGLALDLDLLDGTEPEQVTVEAERALEIRDAEADVREPLERDHRRYAAIVTLIEPVVLSPAVRKASPIDSSGKRCVTSRRASSAPCRRSRSSTTSKSARAPARPQTKEPITRSSLARTKSAGKAGERVNAPSRQMVPPGRAAATAVSSVSASPPTVSMTRSIGASSASPRRPSASRSPATRSAPSASAAARCCARRATTITS